MRYLTGIRHLGVPLACVGLVWAGLLQADDVVIDLAATATGPGSLTRVYGSVGDGRFGLPVAAGGDLNGDGFADYALAAMLADPLGRADAGQIFLVFGDGTVGGNLDTAPGDLRLLSIYGAAPSEHTGSEIWIDDVTGDGLADLLICRQDYTPSGGPTGAGALTLLIGDQRLTSLGGGAIDLASPPPGVQLMTIIGAEQQDRLCMWARTGDMDGDRTNDIALGADQAGPGTDHAGAVYLLRGGSHLAVTGSVALADFDGPGSPLPGNLARINPPANATEYHFGATVQVGDLDGNELAEVVIGAGFARAGGSLAPANAAEPAHGSGGTRDAVTDAREGTAFIVWDELLAGPWPAGFEIDLVVPAPGLTAITGGLSNQALGEELLVVGDVDQDGQTELFVGDLVGRPLGRIGAGLGHLFYAAAGLKGRLLDVDNLPPDVANSLFMGATAGDIASDTAMSGDFDGDGSGDLAFSSPHAAPLGRRNAGALHVFYGQSPRWPAQLDLAAIDLRTVRLTDIFGARGQQGGNVGDTLAYSGAAADIDANGAIDLITNEMVGDGLGPGTVDVGNLLVIGQGLLQPPQFSDGFEALP